MAIQDTVLDVALEVGFNARSSLYKAYKQEIGKIPSEFRKQYSLTLKTKDLPIRVLEQSINNP